MGAQGTAVRRRRRPEEAEREILEAADSLLRELPLHAVSIDAIMRRTTLSRNSFYAYFGDRYAVLLRLFEGLAAKFRVGHAMFLEGDGELLTDGRAALARVATVFAEDGTLMRALLEASAYDADADRLWREMNEPLIGAFADKIRTEIDAGRMVELDAPATARALLGMNIYSFLEQLVDNPDPDPEGLTDLLLSIWARTLLVDRPGPSAGAPPGAGRATD